MARCSCKKRGRWRQYERAVLLARFTSPRPGGRQRLRLFRFRLGPPPSHARMQAAMLPLHPSPTHSGQWALGCDSLGRVLLIDVATSLVVVMLKGYRAAQAAWMEWPAGGVRGPAPGSSVPVIYAPRKGVLEVWAPDLRTRLAVLRGVGPRGVLLSPRPRGAALWFADLDALRCADVAPALVSAAPCG